MEFDHRKTANEEEFFNEGVNILVERISQSIHECGSAIVGLSGGSTPRPIYEALGTVDLPWEKVTIFLVDERYVPSDHKDSNQLLVRETLLKHAQIPEINILFPDTRLPLEECVSDYDMHIAGLLSGGIPHIVTLGLGEDGHIASLFPPVSPSAFKDRLVLHTETHSFAVKDRITITMPVIGSADRKIFFLKGDGKKATWDEMLAGENDHFRWPAKAVLELGGAVVVSQW